MRLCAISQSIDAVLFEKMPLYQLSAQHERKAGMLGSHRQPSLLDS